MLDRGVRTALNTEYYNNHFINVPGVFYPSFYIVFIICCRQAGNPLAEIASFGMKALKMQKLRVRHFMTRTLGNPNATPPPGTS